MSHLSLLPLSHLGNEDEFIFPDRMMEISLYFNIKNVMLKELIRSTKNRDFD